MCRQRYQAYAACFHAIPDGTPLGIDKCSGVREWEGPCEDHCYTPIVSPVKFCVNCNDNVPPDHPPLGQLWKEFREQQQKMRVHNIDKSIIAEFKKLERRILGGDIDKNTGKKNEREKGEIDAMAERDGPYVDTYNFIRDEHKKYKEETEDLIRRAVDEDVERTRLGAEKQGSGKSSTSKHHRKHHRKHGDGGGGGAAGSSSSAVEPSHRHRRSAH
ncbi:hypothetical protein F4780DRAFT_193047 [Xylariomycetidae sp. FL0641]|nr:hypothetical protein F4780DRAFT_193047 [Xylariomycetidae sp. FL0641]